MAILYRYMCNLNEGYSIAGLDLASQSTLVSNAQVHSDSKNHGTVVPPSDTPDTDLPKAWTAWCTMAVTSVRIFTSKSAVEVSLRCSIALLISSEGMGAPNVTLRRAPIRGMKLYGKERPSGHERSRNL